MSETKEPYPKIDHWDLVIVWDNGCVEVLNKWKLPDFLVATIEPYLAELEPWNIRGET